MSTSAFPSRPTTLSFCLLLVVCSALLSVTYARAKTPEFQFDDKGRTLTISTDRYEVVWQNGSIVKLVTMVPSREVLTVPQGTMSVDQLPNGLGSFHLQAEAARQQHKPLGSNRLPASFPAQHPPHASSEMTYKRIRNGAELTYRRLLGDREAVLIQELTVESETGDLVIRQKGSTKNPGVFGLSFGVLNLKPELTLIMPFFAGERWDASQFKGTIQSFAWPRFWSAALVIMDIPGGGCFSVWAQDASMKPKFFHYYNSGNVRGFAFESCEDAPYSGRTEASSCEWRLNTFPGNWIQAASRYKDWMVKGYGITPRKERSPKWVNDIAMFWPNGDFEMTTLDAMSRLIDPKHVLILNWGMLHQFNRRVPEYKPREKDYAKKTAAAREYGFHAGGYTSMLLVDVETHPSILEEYQLNRVYDGLTAEKPEKADHWLVQIHPGNRAWQNFYAGKMKMLHEEYGVDLLYQDVSGAAVGSAGVIEEKTLAAAVVATEGQIRRELPQVALMGEFWNEVNAVHEDFGLMNYFNWFGEDYKKRLGKRDSGHPLLSFLFSDFCLRMAYSKPLRDIRRFHMEENINEVTGAIPYWNTSVTDRSGEAQITILRAKLWAEGFRPHFPENWEPNVVAYMKNEQGEIVRYVADGESTYCYRVRDGIETLVYARVTGVSKLPITTPVRIKPWIAYDTTGPIGMDPNQWYCIFPGEPENMPFQITELPSSATIKGARVTEDFILIEIEGAGSGFVRWQSRQHLMTGLNGGSAASGAQNAAWVNLPTSLLLTPSQIATLDPTLRVETPNLRLDATRQDQNTTNHKTMTLPPEKWKASVVSHGWIVDEARMVNELVKISDGRRLKGYRVLPPLGGRNIETSLDALVRVPDSETAELNALVGLKTSCPGDGVHFVVRANGHEIWRKHKADSQYDPISVSLGAYSGQDIVLSIALDCGPLGTSTSCDDSHWIDTRIIQ